MDLANITLIGAGNVSWHLGPVLENAGLRVDSVYSRDRQNAKALVRRLYDATTADDLNFSNSSSTLFILSVPDHVLPEICREVVLPDHCTLVHTSGAVDISEMRFAAAEGYGVFYPLQTFTKSKKVKWKEVPLLVEGSTKDIEKALTLIAKGISKSVSLVSSQQRSVIHLAAVFACNFPNQMLTIANDLLDENGFSLDILKPLIVETLNKSLELGPEEAQTGPALRNDINTIEKHLSLIEDDDLRKLYQLMTQQIQQRHEAN